MKATNLGRHIFGLAAILFGSVTLFWHDFNGWQQIQALNLPHQAALADLTGMIEIFGGLAVQWPRTARVGAVTLGTLYFAFALFWVPRIIAEPHVYDRWGNFFEQFSQVAGALIVYSLFDRDDSKWSPQLARVGYTGFGICVVSFMLEQLFYLSATARYVPHWIPPGQMFWAVATTFAFGFAAIAMLSGHLSLLASRLLTAMIVGFGLLVWLPIVLANPHDINNWAGNAENLSIAGAAWIVADVLRLRAEARGDERNVRPAASVVAQTQ